MFKVNIKIEGIENLSFKNLIKDRKFNNDLVDQAFPKLSIFDRRKIKLIYEGKNLYIKGPQEVIDKIT